MKRLLTLVILTLSLSACHSRGLDRLLGNDHDENKTEGPPFTVAVVGELPAGNAVTFSPPFDSTETVQSMNVRISGTMTRIQSTPDAGPYFTFDGTTLTVQNYTAAGNQGTFPDNFAFYYTTSHPAGYHSNN